MRACNREKWECAQIKSRIKKHRKGGAKRGGNGRKVMQESENGAIFLILPVEAAM